VSNQKPNNNQKQPPVKQSVSAKVPYAMKVLGDALRKNEEELEYWKKHIRKFSWSRIIKEDKPSEKLCCYTITIAFKDGYGKEILTTENFKICIGNECEITINDYEKKLLKSVINIQAEGNYSPCESRIEQIKEVIEILKQPQQ
jgi:hypothetical protein